MQAPLSLRVSAWVLFAMGLAHTLGHIAGLKEWRTPPDERTRILVTTMNNYMVGSSPVDRSVTSIYLGFSLVVAATPMMMAALVLVASKALQEDRPNLRRLTRIYLAGLLVLSAISINYFIWPPTIFLLTAFGFAAWAMAGLRKA
ncbi:LIC_13387 family protein [Paludibaculum fermentans]|uniref:LIC_13387 family protein n=1 Tax=Paludibaculum fermentans TaxID=1473598 RepID=UPI003EB99573